MIVALAGAGTAVVLLVALFFIAKVTRDRRHP
jgi:hypothetical protein